LGLDIVMSDSGLGHMRERTDTFWVSFWAYKNAFDREYVENGKSQRYMSIRA